MASLVIRLPAITTEMDDGTLLKWLVTVGQHVKEGDPICEFTTDKVDTELESPYTGVITQLLVAEGEGAKVGDGIAVIEGDGPSFLGALDPEADLSDAPQDGEDAVGDSPLVEEPSLVADADEPAPTLEEVRAPRAVRLEAERRGIDIRKVIPTGSRGQVTIDDLEVHQLVSVKPPQVASHPGHTPGECGDAADQPATAEGSDQPVAAYTGAPSEAAHRPAERRSRRAERTGGRRRGRREHLTQDDPTPVEVGSALLAAPQPPTSCVLYAHLDVTDLVAGQEDQLAVLAQLVWAYGRALGVHPEANVVCDTPGQPPRPLSSVRIDVGMETTTATVATAPIAVPVDATLDQVGLAVRNGYDLVRKGITPDPQPGESSASLIDLGPWAVERVSPMIAVPQVTALSIGQVETVPSLIGRTVTIRQRVTVGLAVNTEVLDPVQGAVLMATIIGHASGGEDASTSA